MADALNQDNFEKLLSWLNPEREKAADIYELVRSALIAYFVVRRVGDAEELADLTIDRVASKIDEFEINFEGEKLKLFLTVAKFIRMENYRQNKVEFTDSVQETFGIIDDRIENDILGKNENQQKNRFQECFGKLNLRNKNIVLDFYGYTGKKRLPRYHQMLADKYKMSVNALRIKVFRIRKTLLKCMKKQSD